MQFRTGKKKTEETALFMKGHKLATSALCFAAILWIAVAASGSRPSSIRTYGKDIDVNVGRCYAEAEWKEEALGSQHVRFYYWSLPRDMIDKLMALCGLYHGIHNGFSLDPHPFGRHIARHRSVLKEHSSAMRECTFGRLHDTNQYAMLPSWRPQMILSPLRVDKVEDADVVLVDLYDDICMCSESKAFNETAAMAQETIKMLLEHYDKTRKPHIIPLSKYEQAYYSPRSYGGSLLQQAGAEKMIYLNYEITNLPWYGLNMPGRAPGGNPTNYSYYYVVPAPRPTTLHMYARDKYFSHYLRYADEELRLPDPDSSKSGWPCYIARKEVLASSSFSARFPIRKELKRQCEEAGPSKCLHVETQRFANMFSNTMQDTHDAYAKAWFCLMPHGDTHSRRSFVTCLLQDSIPVLFKNITFDTIPFADILPPSDYVVNLPELEASLQYLGGDEQYRKEHSDVVVKEEARDILGLLEKRYPLELRMKMVSNIFKIKHIYQMMYDPVHEVVRFDQLDQVHCMDDAFTATLKAAVRNACRRGMIPKDRCEGRRPRIVASE